MSEVHDELEKHLASFDEGRPVPKAVLADADLSGRLGDPPVDDNAVDDTLRYSGFDERDEFDERDSRIEALEADNARLVEADIERADRAEWERAAVYIAGQAVGVPFGTIKAAILGEYVSDEDFRDAYDNRGEDPVSYQFALEELVNKFPSGDHGLSAAVIAARDVSVVRSGDGSDDRDWSGMSTQKFAVESKKVFADAKEGKLKSPSGGNRAVQTTYPR